MIGLASMVKDVITFYRVALGIIMSQLVQALTGLFLLVTMFPCGNEHGDTARLYKCVLFTSIRHDPIWQNNRHYWNPQSKLVLYKHLVWLLCPAGINKL